MSNRIRSFTIQIFVLALVCTISSTAWAGIIPISGVQSISGPGLGFVAVPVILTANPDNDNQVGGGPTDNNITVPIKRFDYLDYIDIVFQVNDSTLPDGVTEYKFFESVDNNTSTNWAGYRMELGFGTGANFSLSSPGDGLDFDAPLYDTLPASPAFSTVTTSEDVLVFSNGMQGAGAETYEFRVDVPNLAQRSFTLRQIPIAVPEPGACLLLLSALAGMVVYRRYR